jgi:hypothetical protein
MLKSGGNNVAGLKTEKKRCKSTETGFLKEINVCQLMKPSVAVQTNSLLRCPHAHPPRKLLMLL